MQDRIAKPRRKSVNLTIEAELAAEAKAAGMNLSAILDRALRAELKAHREAQWRVENREAIASVNSYIGRHGLPLAKFRTW